MPGNPGGPGRPKRATERKYLRALVKAVSLEDWREIIKTAVSLAKAGDGPARTWLSKHLVGDDPLPLRDQRERIEALEQQLLNKGT